jgi:serine/threonine protein phosphatase PrpC
VEIFRTFGVTHPGAVRSKNQDAFVDLPELGVWAVADGAGGHESGELASGMVATALQSLPETQGPDDLVAEVRARLQQTNTAIISLAAKKGGGTIVATTVVVLVIRSKQFTCLWAGDSRAYLLRKGDLRRITRDHSVVQQLVDAGKLAASDAERHPDANIITRAIGASHATELDIVKGPLDDGDRFLLCSDGLSKALEDSTLAAILADGQPKIVAAKLLEAALSRNAADNVTAVVVDPL